MIFVVFENNMQTSNCRKLFSEDEAVKKFLTV